MNQNLKFMTQIMTRSDQKNFFKKYLIRAD